MLPSLRPFVVCLSLLCLPAVAAPVAGLYQVREPVQGDEAQSRDQALHDALKTLVQRLTGSKTAADSQALADLRKDPQQIISQFGYDADALVVEFDPGATDRALRAAGLPVWGANRPAILTWWVNEGVDGGQLVGESQDGSALLQRAAQHRGVAVRLPLADLSEQLLADQDQLFSQEPQALREASERYAADALMTVAAKSTGEQWQGRWQLWLGEERLHGQASGADQAALADTIMTAVTEQLAPRFVVKAGAAQRMTLVLSGANLARFAAAERLLEPFSPTLKSVDGDQLTYEVQGNLEQLRAQLALGHLQEQPAVPAEAVSAEPASAPAPSVRFSW